MARPLPRPLSRFLAVRAGSILLALALALLVSAVMGGASGFAQRLVILAGLYVTLAVSLNLINGITGQFSLGHIAFYAVGAYTAAFLFHPADKERPLGLGSQLVQAHLPGLAANPVVLVLVSMLFGAVLAGLAGLLVGLPSLRLKGDYLAIVTLGVGEIVRIFVQNQPSLGRSYGIALNPKVGFVWLSVLLAVTTVAVCRNLQTTARGLNFLAVREDEIAASAMGVDVTRTKVAAFVIGSAFAGAAGAVAAHYEGFISPSLYTMDYSILIVTMVVLGGTGSITGSILAALALFSIPEIMRSFPGTAMGNVIAVLIGLVAATALLRRAAQTYTGGRGARVLRAIVAVALALVVAGVCAVVLARVPALRANVEGNKLRQVIPAVTLVVMMLLRPQGIFGHAELGWHSLFGRFHPESGPGGRPDDRSGGAGSGPGLPHEPAPGLSTEASR